jgi:hypothetical protein
MGWMKKHQKICFLLLRIDKKIKNKHTPYLNITEGDGGGRQKISARRPKFL